MISNICTASKSRTVFDYNGRYEMGAIRYLLHRRGRWKDSDSV